MAVLLDEEQLAQRILTAGEHLLKHYVMLQGERLGALVKKSLSTSDWLTRKEPRDSRAVVDVLVDEVNVPPAMNYIFFSTAFVLAALLGLAYIILS